MLSERIGTLLEEVSRRFGADVPVTVPEDEVDTSPLEVPVEEEFRVGTMGLGWDAESRNVVVELLAVTEEEIDESVVLDDTDEGPDALRVFLSPAGAARVRHPRRARRRRRAAPVPAVHPAARLLGPHLPAAERLPTRRLPRVGA